MYYWIYLIEEQPLNDQSKSGIPNEHNFWWKVESLKILSQERFCFKEFNLKEFKSSSKKIDKNKSSNSWKQIRLNDAKRKNVFVFCISMSKYIEAYPECDAAKNFRLKMIHHKIMNATI